MTIRSILNQPIQTQLVRGWADMLFCLIVLSYCNVVKKHCQTALLRSVLILCRSCQWTKHHQVLRFDVIDLLQIISRTLSFV